MVTILIHKQSFAISIENEQKNNSDLENEYLKMSLESILDSLKKRKFKEKIVLKNYTLYKYHSHWVYYIDIIGDSEILTDDIITLWTGKTVSFLDKNKKIKFKLEIKRENEERLKKELNKKTIVKIDI